MLKTPNSKLEEEKDQGNVGNKIKINSPQFRMA